jgi:chemotaxis protein MotB
MMDIPHIRDDNEANGEDETAIRPKRYKVNFSEAPAYGVPIWLMSMTDLMGIILTFFVLLYSMSEIKKPEAIIGTPPPEPIIFSEMGTYMGGGQSAGESDSISINKIEYNQALNLGYLKSVLENLAADIPILKKVRVVEDAANQRLIIMLPQDLLFDKGQAEINKDGLAAVNALTEVLRHIPNGIELVGHADPSQAKSGITNWDISLSRAMSVARLMSAAGYSRTLPVMGLSSGLYDQLPTTLSQAQREAMARRVDLIINLHNNTFQQRFGIGPQ